MTPPTAAERAGVPAIPGHTPPRMTFVLCQRVYLMRSNRVCEASVIGRQWTETPDGVSVSYLLLHEDGIARWSQESELFASRADVLEHIQ